MNTETRTAAIVHAITEYPKESCGLVLIHEGVEEYYPCKNTAVSKSEHFVMNPVDYADAEDRGEITAVVHSHPDVSPKPSEADRVSCERSGLPWYIFSVHKNVETGIVDCIGDYAFNPSGYKSPLIGREFSYGILDCYTLIQDYYKEEFGIDLIDPIDKNIDHHDGWWLKGYKFYEENYEAFGWERVNDAPRKGDVVLMQIRSKTPNHAAVYLGDGHILHHLYGRLSSRDVYGGYWRETTRYMIRYKGKP